jgi:hypothetical protein
MAEPLCQRCGDTGDCAHLGRDVEQLDRLAS